MGGSFSQIRESRTKRESLHEAIRRKDVKKVKQIIYSNDLDVKNDFKSLELATLYNLTEIVELLLNRGCIPSDKRTARAFDLAVWKCHKDIATMFLKAGIEYKGRNQYNETILYVAACGNNSTLTEILIEGGCDLNECTRSWTALHVAAARNHDDVLRVLVKHGCDLNIRDRDGFNALMLAVLNENLKNIKLLVLCGCSIKLDELYSTPCLAKQLMKYPEIERILWQEVSRVKDLKELCRQKMRNALSQRLWRKVNFLNLPKTLKDYVALKDLFMSFEQQQPSVLRSPTTEIQKLEE
ncbi:unnamed protein product [Didymodactylos carnosus]|uniref:SOCS box domain-containing protein n=1 Tax=Didymodactylos carnosus TaxID=1234261 RepID=A0A813TBC0_9BILA|nr:unnamed protein product [Didymodactylos carnosus]CAF1292874.1 unnamed protein product [Didymodactylos carnosus]CAF3597141.1 unnamed protein product [Didymodactylos carnosus]CAF4097702.1 unnamed protein product [Didymodactylos carnosus]